MTCTFDNQIKTLDRGTLNGGKTGISGTPGWEEDWNYDPTGNWHGSSTAYPTKVAGSTTLNQNRSHNQANEITNISTASGTSWPTPTHDTAGNMLTCPRPLSLGDSFDLKWDAWNRLVEVKNTGGSVVATYGYDGANRRVTKVTGGNTHHYYYSDQWQVLEERLNSGADAEQQFVWGIRSQDDLVLRDQASERLYALHDAMSVTAIVDASGGVEERYGYDGFGTPRYMTPAFGSRLGFSFSLHNPRTAKVERHCVTDLTNGGSLVWYTGEFRARLTFQFGLKLLGVGLTYSQSITVTEKVLTPIVFCDDPCKCE